MKKIFSFLLCLIMLISTISFQVFAYEKGDTAKSLTKEWYGGLNSVIVSSDADEGVITNDLLKLLEKYLKIREMSFNSEKASADFSIFADESSAEKVFAERKADVEKFENRINSIIDYAEATLKITSAENENGRIILTVYEWTFYDYFDKAGDMSATDVSGFGVTHEMVVEEIDGKLLITSDNYDDATLDFDEYVDVTSTNSVEANEENNGGFTVEDFEADTNGEFVAGYDIGAAVAYSDTYWYNYNPAWYNFASLGGDCANFVSQCLYAGGMPMHYGAAYSSTCWYYTTSSDRSGSWTGAPQSYSYWGNYRGVPIAHPNNSQIWVGCPVYVDWTSDGLIDHAYFCVGRNSSGTAIINSHTGDQYHINWNYGDYYASYYTVQVTAQEGSSVSFKKQLEGHDPINIGENFCAHIRQTATGLYVTDKDYNVSVTEGVFDESQTWHFVRQSNGAYVISTDSSGLCWDVTGANYSDGTNIQMYGQGSNNYAQQFFVYYIDGNFYFKCTTEDKTIDIDAATHNMQLWECETGIASKDTDPTRFNARSFEILKINLDYSTWNMYIKEDFTCFIKNADTGYLLTASDSDVNFQYPTYEDNQKWIVTRNEFGGHVIKSVSNGKALDVDGAKISQGADIQLWEENGSKAQSFFFINAGHSLVYIKPSYSPYVMDMDADSKEVHTYPYGYSDLHLAAQRFELVTDFHIDENEYIRDSHYLGETIEANITMVTNGTAMTDMGDGVQMSNFTGSEAQKWTLTYDKEWNAYKIVGNSGKALDIEGAYWWDDANVGLYESNDTPAQRFRFYTYGNGYYISPAYTQRVFDVDTNTGTELQLWGANGADNRLFKINILSRNGKAPANLGETFTTTVTNKATGLNLSYNADDGIEFTNTATEWKFTRQEDGSYTIVSVDNGKAIDIENIQVEPGTRIQLWEVNGTKAQNFYIYESNGGYILMATYCASVLDMDADTKKVSLYPTGTGDIQVNSQTVTFENVSGEVEDNDVIVIKSGSDYVKNNAFVTKVKVGVKANEFLKNFDNTSLVVKDNSGKQVSDKQAIGTGYSVNLVKNGEIIDSLDIVISGDVDGNGVIDTTDYLRIKGVFLGSYNLKGAFFKAGDVDGNEIIDTTDYLRIKGYFIGTYNLDGVYYKSADTTEDCMVNSTDYLRIKSHFIGQTDLYA